jgi:hypothetical protein
MGICLLETTTSSTTSAEHMAFLLQASMAEQKNVNGLLEMIEHKERSNSCAWESLFI